MFAGSLPGRPEAAADRTSHDAGERDQVSHDAGERDRTRFSYGILAHHQYLRIFLIIMNHYENVARLFLSTQKVMAAPTLAVREPDPKQAKNIFMKALRKKVTPINFMQEFIEFPNSLIIPLCYIFQHGIAWNYIKIRG